MKPTRIAVSKPCGNCPFRVDVAPFLRPGRVRDIWHAARYGQHFVCHKTVDYDLPGGAEDLDRRACAGFLIVAKRSALFDGLTIVQLAERLAGIRFDLQGADRVYASADAMIEAHDESERRCHEPRRARNVSPRLPSLNAGSKPKPPSRASGATDTGFTKSGSAYGRSTRRCSGQT